MENVFDCYENNDRVYVCLLKYDPFMLCYLIFPQALSMGMVTEYYHYIFTTLVRHTHTITHTLSLSHTHRHTHKDTDTYTHTRPLSLSHTQRHRHTHTHTHTLSFSHTHTHTHALSLKHTLSSKLLSFRFLLISLILLMRM